MAILKLDHKVPPKKKSSVDSDDVTWHSDLIWPLSRGRKVNPHSRVVTDMSPFAPSKSQPQECAPCGAQLTVFKSFYVALNGRMRLEVMANVVVLTLPI